METWGEFTNALDAVSMDEEMMGDTVPVVLPEPMEDLVWQGDSILVTMDDEITEIVATGDVIEHELQVAVLVRMNVGEAEQTLAGVILFDSDLDVVVVHEFELEGESVSVPSRVRVVLSERLEEHVIDVVRDAIRDGMPLGTPVTLCESML